VWQHLNLHLRPLDQIASRSFGSRDRSEQRSERRGSSRAQGSGDGTRVPQPSTHVGPFSSLQHCFERNVEGLPAIGWSHQKARQTQVTCNARPVLHFASNLFICLRADQQHDVSSTRRLRAWKTNLLQVLQAVLFVFVIWAVDKAITYSRERMPAFSQVHSPSATAVASIPECTQNQYLKACSHFGSCKLLFQSSLAFDCIFLC
jgi:hypothetical protein